MQVEPENSTSTKELIDKIKESTSDTRDDLEVREVHEDDVLHFVIKKETLKQRIKRKLTGKSEGKDNETLRASKDLLLKGVWAEIETETNHVWAKIQVTDSLDNRIIVRVANQKSTSEDNLLGLSEKNLQENGAVVYLPNMALTFQDKGKKGWNINAKSRGSVITRAAEGLVGLWRDEQSNKEFYVVFDQKGDRSAQEDGSRAVKDLRTLENRTELPCDFYRLGEEPFVCFDVERMGYTDGE